MKKIERTGYRVKFQGTVKLPFPSDGNRDGLASLASHVTVDGAIDPRRLGDIGIGTFPDERFSSDPAGAYHNRCRDIVEWIRREYGDDIKTQILWDELAFCSHCREPWDVLSAEDVVKYADMLGSGEVEGLPQCCPEAQDEWRAAQAGVTA